MKTPTEILDGVIELLQSPQHWCKKSYARGLDGCDVLPTSANAICWDIRGAIQRVNGYLPVDAVDYAIARAIGRHGFAYGISKVEPRTLAYNIIISFNDDANVDHSTVIAILYCARAFAMGCEQ